MNIYDNKSSFTPGQSSISYVKLVTQVKQTERTIMIGARLGEKTEGRLAHLAQVTGRSKSYYLKQAIEKFLDEREEYLIALSQLEKVNQGESTIDIKELRKRLDEMDD